MDEVISIETYRERRTKWLEALRSGKYKQTKNCLFDGEGFCCLGVACDVSKLGSWEYRGGYQYYLQKYGLLPIEVIEYYGFTSPDPKWVSNQCINSLSLMNDLSNFDFNYIADFVEANPHLIWKEGTY